MTDDGGDDGAGADAHDVVEEPVHGGGGEALQLAQHLDGDQAPDAAPVERQHPRPPPLHRARPPHQRQRLPRPKIITIVHYETSAARR